MARGLFSTEAVWSNHVPDRREPIARRGSCCAQARGDHPWPPVQRMRLTHGGAAKNIPVFRGPARDLTSPPTFKWHGGCVSRLPGQAASGGRGVTRLRCRGCSVLVRFRRAGLGAIDSLNARLRGPTASHRNRECQRPRRIRSESPYCVRR
jgi:hypothetical protein